MDPSLPTPPSPPPPSPPPPPPPPSLPSTVATSSPVISVNASLLAVILDSTAALLSLVRYYFRSHNPNPSPPRSPGPCLAAAAHWHDQLRSVLDCFEEERMGNVGGEGVKTRYKETMAELRGFKEAGDPLTEGFFTLLGSVGDRMLIMYENVKEKKRRGDKKLNRGRVYRKVSRLSFVGVFVAVVMCTIVTVVIGVSRSVAVLAMLGVSGPLATVGICFDVVWRKYEDEMKGERVLIGDMNVGSFVVVKDLDNIRVLVDKLEVKL